MTRIHFVLLYALLCLATSILDRSYYDVLCTLPFSLRTPRLSQLRPHQISLPKALQKVPPRQEPRKPGPLRKNQQRYPSPKTAYETLYDEGKKYLYDRVGI